MLPASVFFKVAWVEMMNFVLFVFQKTILLRCRKQSHHPAVGQLQFAAEQIRVVSKYVLLKYEWKIIRIEHMSFVCMYIFVYACMFACMYVCMYVCMHICMFVCVYACMCVCMCECICLC